MVSGRAVALASLGALLLGTVLMLVLHVVPPTSEISPVRRTLSQYAIGPNKWLFDLSVLLVAAGSALGFAGLVSHRLIRPLSAGVVFGALWIASLLVIVVFTKTNWALGPSIGGTVHRYASVVGFVSLPLAVIVVARAVFPGALGWRLVAQGLGTVSLGLFGVLLLGVVRMVAGGGPWWRFVPLGLVERAIATTSVAAISVVVLGVLLRIKSDDTVPVPA